MASQLRAADDSSGPEEGELSESESSASERPHSPGERSHSPNWNRSPVRAAANKTPTDDESGAFVEEQLPEEEPILKQAKFSPTVASQDVLTGTSTNSELQGTAGESAGDSAAIEKEQPSRRSSRSTGSHTRAKTPPRSVSREKSGSRSRSRSRSATRSLSRSSQPRALEQSEAATKAKSTSKSRSKSKSKELPRSSRSSSGSRKRRSPTNNFPNCSSCSRRSTETLSTRSSSEPEVVEDGDTAREQALTTGKRKGEFYVYNPNYRNQHYQRGPGGRPEPPLVREHRLRPENANMANLNPRREWGGPYARGGGPPVPLPLPPPPDPNWVPPPTDYYYYDPGPGYGYEGEYWPPYRPPPPPMPLPPMPPRARPVPEYADYPPADFPPPPGDYYPPPPDIPYDDRAYYEGEAPGRNSRSRSPIPAGSKRSPSVNGAGFRRARSNSLRQ